MNDSTLGRGGREGISELAPLRRPALLPFALAAAPGPSSLARSHVQDALDLARRVRESRERREMGLAAALRIFRESHDPATACAAATMLSEDLVDQAAGLLRELRAVEEARALADVYVLDLEAEIHDTQAREASGR
jgi:hypothetical protein